jgi:hypothetical protein
MLSEYFAFLVNGDIGWLLDASMAGHLMGQQAHSLLSVSNFNWQTPSHTAIPKCSSPWTWWWIKDTPRTPSVSCLHSPLLDRKLCLLQEGYERRWIIRGHFSNHI